MLTWIDVSEMQNIWQNIKTVSFAVSVDPFIIFFLCFDKNLHILHLSKEAVRPPLNYAVDFWFTLLSNGLLKLTQDLK